MPETKKNIFLSALKLFDMLGNNYSFKHKESTKFKTKLGGIFTIVAYLCITGTTYVFTQNYFDTSNPNMSVSTRIDNTIPKRNLYEKTFPIGVGIFGKNSTFVPSVDLPKYITPLIFVFELNYEKVESGVITFDAVDMIAFTSCNSVQDPTLVEDFLEGESEEVNELIRKQFLCPDIKNKTKYYVKGNILQAPFRIIQLGLYPCSLEDPNNCEPEAVISSSTIGFMMAETSFLPENKKSPLKKVPLTKKFQIGSEQEMRWEMSLKETQIIDDDGEFTERRMTHSFIDPDDEKIFGIKRALPATHCNMSLILSLTCPAYISLTIRSSGKTVSIVRVYPKILDLMGEVGGTSEIIFFIIGLFYYGYNWYFKKKLIRKSFLEYDCDEYKEFLGIGKGGRKEWDELMNEVVKRRDEFFRLYWNQNSWEILQHVIFDDYHKVLFPLVLLETEKRKKTLEKKIPSKMKASFQFSGKQSIELAFQELKRSKPESEIKKSLKRYFMENLPSGIKDHADQPRRVSLENNLLNRDEPGKKKGSKNLSGFDENKINFRKFRSRRRRGIENFRKKKDHVLRKGSPLKIRNLGKNKFKKGILRNGEF